MRNKKFIQVVFLKNLSFKAEEKDIISYFEGKNITKISIPKSESNDKKGFAYV
jgi:RNA recognition motif-containing protein